MDSECSDIIEIIQTKVIINDYINVFQKKVLELFLALDTVADLRGGYMGSGIPQTLIYTYIYIYNVMHTQSRLHPKTAHF